MFGVILVCFLLPFLTVTCLPGSVIGIQSTVTGIQAATGITHPGSDGKALEPLRGRTPIPDPLALLALVCAVSGLALAATRGIKGLRDSAVAAAVGGLALAGFVGHAVVKTNGEILIPEAGLDLALLFFLGAVALDDLLLLRVDALVAGDTPALRVQLRRAGKWFGALGAVAAMALFLPDRLADLEDSIGPYLPGLAFVVSLSAVGLVFAFVGYRRARTALEGKSVALEEKSPTVGQRP
jgi:hypothetical protein